MKKYPIPLLIFWLFLSTAWSAHAGMVGDLYLAKYEGHSISIEVDVGLLGNVCRLYIDGSLVGEEKVFTVGHPKSLRSRINDKEVLVSVNEGMIATDVKMFIDGTEISLKQER